METDWRLPLRDRVSYYIRDGYQVVVETPTSAQLTKRKHFNPLEFLAMPIYLLEYLGQRDLNVYLSLEPDGRVVERGNAVERSTYRRGQSLSGPMRLAIVLVPVVVLIGLVLVISATTR